MFPSLGEGTETPEDGKRSNFRSVVFSVYLEFRTMGKVHKPSHSECCTTSSEPLDST
jgi:hypothetical protein